MPVDPQIALQVKPPVLPDLDMKGNLLTLAQFRYLGEEAAKLRQETAQKQRAFADQARVGPLTQDYLKTGTLPGQTGMLSSIGRPQAPPPSAPQPGTLSSTPLAVDGPTGAYAQTPPAAPPQASPRPPAARSIFDPEFQAALHTAAPYAAGDYIKGAAELAAKRATNHLETLKLAGEQLQYVLRQVGTVHDQSSWSALLAAARSTGLTLTGVPEQYSAAAKAQLASTALTLQDQHKLLLDQGKLKVEQQNADTAALIARHFQVIPTGTGYAVVSPVTGQGRTLSDDAATPGAPPGASPGLPSTPSASPGTPLSSPAQTARASEFHSGWMNSAQNQAFLHNKQAFGRMTDAAPLKTGASDRVLVEGFTALIGDRGHAATPGAPAALGLGTLSEQAQGEISRLFSSGTALTDPVRDEILAAAKKVHAGQIAEHKVMLKHMRNMATDLKVPNVERVIPDLSESAPAPAGSPTGQAAPGSTSTPRATPGGRSISLDELRTLMTHPSARGKSRAQVIHELAGRGIRVRPDEERP